MSVECSECEMDARAGHDPTCSRYDPRMADCLCDPERHPSCPVHAAGPVEARRHAFVSGDEHPSGLRAAIEHIQREFWRPQFRSHSLVPGYLLTGDEHVEVVAALAELDALKAALSVVSEEEIAAATNAFCAVHPQIKPAGWSFRMAAALAASREVLIPKEPR